MAIIVIKFHQTSPWISLLLIMIVLVIAMVADEAKARIKLSHEPIPHYLHDGSL